jgi:hypothetical protein
MLSSGSGITSVAHQLSCFGVGFSLCLITRACFFASPPFSGAKVSDPSAGPLLSECCDGLLIIFQFFSVVWLWMVLTGSGDELCWLLPAVSGSGLSPTCCHPFCLSSLCLLDISSLLLPPSPAHFGNSIPLLCASFQFLVGCSGFFFFFCGSR